MIAKEQGLAPLTLPEIPKDLEDLLPGTLEQVERDAEERIAQHIQQCGGRAELRSWIEQGLDYTQDDICPFCGQALAGSDLIRAYRAVFSQAYRDHKARIETARSQLEQDFGEAARERIRATLADNANRARFWARYINVETEALEAPPDWVSAWNAFYEKAKSALDEKARTPLDVVPCEALGKIIPRLENVMTAFEGYNKTVASINDAICNLKAKMSSEAPTAVARQLMQLKLTKERYRSEIVDKCDTYRKLVDHRSNMQHEKEKKEHNLERLSVEILERCHERINDLLSCLNAGFRLMKMEYKKPGGYPEATWLLNIRARPIALGNKDTPLSQPSFKNTLSAGDRSALAFAFFIAQLELKPDLAERIVVFDDPFTSLDKGREEVTKENVLHLMHKKVDQIVVLSHQPTFLGDLAAEIERADKPHSELEVRWGQESGAKLKKVDMQKLATDRMLIFEGKMIAYFKVGEGDPDEIASGLRRYVEQKLKTLYREEVAHEDTLGTILNKSVGKMPATSMEALRRVKAFGDRRVHATATEHDEEMPDPNEIRGMIRDVLDAFSAIYRSLSQ